MRMIYQITYQRLTTILKEMIPLQIKRILTQKMMRILRETQERVEKVQKRNTKRIY
jgi:hypothetical protein